MKNFKEFVIKPKESQGEPEDVKVDRREETVNYFNKLKEAIDKAGGYYTPGDLVAEIIDIEYEPSYSLRNGQSREIPKPEANCTTLYVRRRDIMSGSLKILKILKKSEVGVPDIDILKEIMEAEGLRVQLRDWTKEIGKLADVYVDNNEGE